jgi:hypothetical protein
MRKTELIIPSADFYSLSLEILEEGAALRFRAHGRSMFPFIRDGDILEVQKAGPDRIFPGCIALYRTDGGSLLAHRVIGREAGVNSRWVTRGDARFVPDPPLEESQLLGIVSSVERNGRILRMDKGFRRLAGRFWLRSFVFRRMARFLNRTARAAVRKARSGSFRNSAKKNLHRESTKASSTDTAR